jgi:hypothetical protein
MATQHPDFSMLAARISVSNLQKMTLKSFSETAAKLRSHIHPVTKQPAPLMAEDVFEVIMANKERIDSAIIYDRDFEFDYFGFKTLERRLVVVLDQVRTKDTQKPSFCFFFAFAFSFVAFVIVVRRRCRASSSAAAYSLLNVEHA